MHSYFIAWFYCELHCSLQDGKLHLNKVKMWVITANLESKIVFQHEVLGGEEIEKLIVCDTD